MSFVIMLFSCKCNTKIMYQHKVSYVLVCKKTIINLSAWHIRSVQKISSKFCREDVHSEGHIHYYKV